MTTNQHPIHTQLATYMNYSTSVREVMSDSTRNSLRLCSAQFFRHCQAAAGCDITADPAANALLFEQYLNSTNRKNSSKRIIIHILGKFLTTFGYLTRLDYERMERGYKAHYKPWSDKALGDEEVIALLTIFQRRGLHIFSRRRDYTMLVTALLTGGRVGQITYCNKWDVEEDGIVLWFKRQKSRDQSLKPKHIPFGITLPNGDNTERIYKTYLQRRAEKYLESDWLFPNKQGTELHKLYFGEVLTRESPFPVHPHQLRHTAGTIVANRVGILQAAELLDHSNVTTTQRYVRRGQTTTSATIERAWA